MTVNKSMGKGLPATTTIDFEVRSPFKIMGDKRRRFIRIDIDEPVSFTVIKAGENQFWPNNDGPCGEGEVLNISAGGMLLYVREPLSEGSIISMSLSIEGCAPIDSILGKIKRIDPDSGGYLVGVESITREKLADTLSQSELDLLPDELSSFNERLQNLLNDYVYSKKLDGVDDD